jgi:hypothetical protein
MAAAAAGSQVKFAGALVADPLSGQLTAKLRNLPEASFKRMSLDFDGGPGALLATPLECGPATATATLVPYSATPPVNRGATVSVEGSGGACTPVRFAPSLIAGSTKAKAGSPTAFTATVHRADGEAVPERLTLTLPPGMGAALGSVSRCQPTAAGACPPSSRVGATVAELGPGPNPAQIKGEIYLTGPYRHAPFGLLLSFAAKLGPFDLGTLSVRAALRIDPQSGRVSIATDRLPTVFEGLLIRFQSIGLDLDRPGFIRNPTSCQASKVAASLSSANGSQARPSTPFLIRGCIDLPFRPQLSMALSGPAPELRKGGKPSLAVETRIPKGHANLRSLQIRFPKLLTLDTSGLREICARTDALRGECPKGSEVGRAAARSPLLAKAMRGEVYLAQPQDNGPPDLWVDLEGEGIEVSLRGETAVEDGRLLTRFARLPDFALSALALRFDGGGGGVLELGRGGCGRSLSALGEIGGQNGARVKDRVAVGVRGGCGERQG